MVHFEIELHHLVDIEGFHPTGDGHAHGVAHKGGHMVVFQKGRIFGEDRAFFGFLDVGFDRDQTFFASFGEDVKKHLQ